MMSCEPSGSPRSADLKVRTTSKSEALSCPPQSRRHQHESGAKQHHRPRLRHGGVRESAGRVIELQRCGDEAIAEGAKIVVEEQRITERNGEGARLANSGKYVGENARGIRLGDQSVRDDQIQR